MRKRITLTPLFFAFSLALALCVVVIIDCLLIRPGGGNQLGGVLALFPLFFLVGFLFLEQTIAKSYRHRLRRIWIIELLLILVAAFIIFFSGAWFNPHYIG